MHIIELLSDFAPLTSLSPSQYRAVASQRDAVRQQQRKAMNAERQRQQQLRQQAVAAKSRATKPIAPKLTVKRRKTAARRKTRTR